MLREYRDFFWQFRERFETTGAIAPSSRFLAHAITRPMRSASGPRRILEVGPGTGAFTRAIARSMEPCDRLDLVELNASFVEILNERFSSEGAFQRVAERAQIHSCPIETYKADEPYDFIVSGLPLNNFSVAMVEAIYATLFRLLRPGGTLSYFEYMFVRPIKRQIVSRVERERLNGLDEIANRHYSKNNGRRQWIFLNLPPAWVRHLTINENGAD